MIASIIAASDKSAKNTLEISISMADGPRYVRIRVYTSV